MIEFYINALTHAAANIFSFMIFAGSIIWNICCLLLLVTTLDFLYNIVYKDWYSNWHYNRINENHAIIQPIVNVNVAIPYQHATTLLFSLSSPPVTRVQVKTIIEQELEKLTALDPAIGVYEFANDLLCPITKTLMLDPVVIITGNTFDRPAIETWFRTNNTDPLEGSSPLASKIMIPNHTVKRIILAELQKLYDQKTQIHVDSTPLVGTRLRM